MTTEERQSNFYSHVRVYRFLRQEYKYAFKNLFTNDPYRKYIGSDYIENIVNSMRNNK